MKSMAAQFKEKLKPRLDSVQAKVGDDVAEMFANRMKANTREGRGFGNDQYDATYSTSHAKRRQRKGLQTGRVDLRMDQHRIEQTVVQTTGAKTAVKFQDGGEIFKLHHDGTAKGNKTRSIWPKAPESVPDELIERAKELIGGVLRGN